MSMEKSTYPNGTLRGTMTVFMGMTILMLLSIFFSLLEVLHYISLREESAMLSDIGIESMFADYCRPLWDEYGVLGIDGGYGGETMDMGMASKRMESYLVENADVSVFSEGGNHLALAVDACEVESYGLLTDDAGVPFMKECAAAALYGIPEHLLEGLKGQADIAEDGQMDWEDMLTEGDEAYQSAMEEREREEEIENGDFDADADSAEADDGSGDANGAEGGIVDGEKEGMDDATDGLYAEEAAGAGNPIKMVLEWKDEGILKQVVSMDTVSKKSMSEKEIVSARQLAKGNDGAELSLSATERLLFQYYLSEHLSSYTQPKERKGLSYELEYVIGAEDSDKANLAATVERLLVFRGVMNLASLVKDGEKVAEANAVAMALVGVTANPVIIKAVESGVIAAWVYAESVLDIRTLLSGGKIAVVKTPVDWTSDLFAFAEYMDMDFRAKENTNGIDYQTCLITMLTIVPQKEIGLRALDVMENNLRQIKDYRNVRMDNFVYCAKVNYGYRAVPVFGSLVTAGQKPDGYAFWSEKRMNYIE